MRLAKKQTTKCLHRAIVIPDSHAPLHDRQAFECVLQAIELLQPDRVIHLGDIGEWESVNHHRYKRQRQPDPHEVAKGLRRDVRAVRYNFLDLLDEACDSAGVSHKDITTGNHDEWLNRFVAVNPDYARTSFDDAKGYRFEQALCLKERGWTVYPCGKRFRIGELSFYHGHLYGGMYHAANHLRRLGVNVMYGHWHDVQYAAATHDSGAKGAWSLGCIKKKTDDANEWLAFRPTNWGQAFAVVDWWSRGRFTVHSINIIDGQCSLLTGSIIDGRKPRPIVRTRKG
jgi:hypothetical protein